MDHTSQINFYDSYVSQLEKKYLNDHDNDHDGVDLEDLENYTREIVQSTPKQSLAKTVSTNGARSNNVHAAGTATRKQSNSSKRMYDSYQVEDLSDDDNELNTPITTNNNNKFAGNQLENLNFTSPDVALQCEFLKNTLDIIKKRQHYGNFLCKLIIEQLVEHLGPTVFELFLKDEMPLNFIALIKVNKKNVPTVEFLIKSNHSDEDYLKQLSCTPRQIELSSEILQEIRENYFLTLCSKVTSQQKQIQMPRPQPTQRRLPITNGVTPRRTSLQVAIKKPTQRKAASFANDQIDSNESNCLNSSILRRNPRRSCKK